MISLSQGFKIFKFRGELPLSKDVSSTDDIDTEKDGEVANTAVYHKLPPD